MSYSGTSNGVGYRIDPFFTGTRNADFATNAAGGTPQTIHIAFDRDVLSCAFEVRGASDIGNTIIGYDVNGNQVDIRGITADSLSLRSGLGRFFGRETDFAQYEIRGTAQTPLRSVRIIPVDRNSLGIRGLSLFSAVTPYQPPPVILTPGQNAGLSQTVDLATLVNVSVPAVDRTYIKNSMLPIQSQEILIRNLSNEIDIRCGLRGGYGVSYEPSTIDLLRGTTVPVTVLFDVAQINDLQEGTNTFTTIFDLTTSTPIVQAPPPIEVVPPPPPIEMDVYNIWKEERFHGAPQGDDNTSLGTIFASAPYLTQNVQNINYGDGSFGAPTTVRWTGTWFTDSGRYQFNATADDGIRVWVDNTLVVDDWRMGGARTTSRVLDMSAGPHDMRVEYFNGNTHCMATFSFNKVATVPPTEPPEEDDPRPRRPPTDDVDRGAGDEPLRPGGGGRRPDDSLDDWYDSNDGFRRYEQI